MSDLDDRLADELFGIGQEEGEETLDGGGSSPSPKILGGAYLLREKIGEGGMAKVFRAEVDLSSLQGKSDKTQCQNLARPGPQVAIKVARREHDLERFESEWKLLLAQRHPHVMEVYGGGNELGRPWYAMQYIPQPIGPSIFKETADLKDKIEMAIQACEGLHHLHCQGIIHRDIKPSNLMIHRDHRDRLRLVVCDLGISLDENRSVALTQSGALLGTPHYMAPEQVKDARSANIQSDIYALGLRSTSG